MPLSLINNFVFIAQEHVSVGKSLNKKKKEEKKKKMHYCPIALFSWINHRQT